MPQISVVVALYNKEQFVQKCIDSVLSQSFQDFELIIVDDGSTDKSLAKAKSYNDARVSIIEQKNSGPGLARNVGVDHSSGQLLTFIDADDFWEEKFLETAINCLENSPNCDVFICGANWIPEGGMRFPVLSIEHEAESGVYHLEPQEDGGLIHEALNFFTTGAVVVRREVFLMYGGFFTKNNCRSGEDAFLWAQVMFNHYVYREMNCLLNVNIEGSSLGISTGSIKPIHPILMYSDDIKASCPSNYLSSLNQLLNFMAFLAVRRQIHQLKIFNVFMLNFGFPGMKKYKTSEFGVFPFTLLAKLGQRAINLIINYFKK